MEGGCCYDGGATSSPTMSADDLGSPVLSPSSPRKAGGRRSARKRVVTVLLADVSGPRPNGVGEGNTPTDSWTWRKYGQKPIKGSPYPRAYYRCSSSKGCPAKKQMERSLADPAMVVVTYSSEHNHSAKVPRASQSRQVQKHKPQAVTPEPAEPEGVYGKDAAVDVHDEFRWFYDGVSTSPSEEKGADEMLYGPMFLDAGAVDTAPVLLLDECGGDEVGFGGEGGEEDGMFAGLGELPECAIVFRPRGCLAGGVKAEQPPERTATS